jgi:3-phosphoglycerate kinase
MAKFRTPDDIHVRGKRVLLHADLNVPVEAAWSLTRRASNGWRRRSRR